MKSKSSVSPAGSAVGVMESERPISRTCCAGPVSWAAVSAEIDVEGDRHLEEPAERGTERAPVHSLLLQRKVHLEPTRARAAGDRDHEKKNQRNSKKITHIKQHDSFHHRVKGDSHVMLTNNSTA